jgi:KDO2-lipid IV(A) lauroyltransferase
MMSIARRLAPWFSDAHLRRERLREGRQSLEYVGFRAIVALVRSLPIDVATSVVAAICRAYSVRTRRHRRALANLALAMPELSSAERERIVRAMWENVGRVIAEAAHVSKFLAEPHRLDCIDMRVLDDYEEKRGLYLIVSLHTGNWEIGLLRQMLRGFQPAAFYRIVDNPHIDDYLRRSRERIMPGGMFAVRNARGGRSSAENTSRAIVTCLRKGLPIGILADHRDHDGIVVRFFGQDVRVSRVPATLALQFNAPLGVARTVRIGRSSRFMGDGTPIEVPKTGDRQADIHAATQAIFRQFEAWIREYPEQWLWSQAPFLTSAEVYSRED